MGLPNDAHAPATSGVRVKSFTVGNSRELTQAEREERSRIALEVLPERPRSRTECVNLVRPCPFVTCERHLATDVTSFGSLQLNFPVERGVLEADLDAMPDTCVDDVAARGPQTFDRIARALNVCDSRGAQLVNEALGEMEAKLKAAGIEGDTVKLLIALGQGAASGSAG